MSEFKPPISPLFQTFGRLPTAGSSASTPNLTPKRGGGLCLTPSALRPADIIVTTDSTSPISNTIRTSSGRDPGKSAVSHGMLFEGGGRVIEAVATGVVETPLTKALEHATLAVVYRHRGVDDRVGLDIVAAARKSLGAKYDYKGAIAAGVREAPLKCVAAGGFLPGVMLVMLVTCAALATVIDEEPDKFFCTELIATSYEKAGVQLLTSRRGSRASSVTPAGIAEAGSRGVLAYVGHLVTTDRG